MLSFKSSRINDGYIQKRIILDLYQDSKAPFVEFSTDSLSDISAVSDTANNWRKIAGTKTFANDITDEMKDCRKYGNNNESRFFGVTLQADTFEKMDSEKIIGLAEVSHIPEGRFDESDVFILDYLQTIPNSIYPAQIRDFKNIGQTMLDLIISIFKSKPIVLIPTDFSKRFYLNNGFLESAGKDFLILKR